MANISWGWWRNIAMFIRNCCHRENISISWTLSPGLSCLEVAVTSRKRKISRISIDFYCWFTKLSTETVNRGRESQQLQNWLRAKYFRIFFRISLRKYYTIFIQIHFNIKRSIYWTILLTILQILHDGTIHNYNYNYICMYTWIKMIHYMNFSLFAEQ